MKNCLVLLMTCIALNGFGQTLMDYNFFSCSERSYPEFIRHRIVSKEKNEDSLTIRIALVLNCCTDPELELSISNDSLFVTIQNTSETICGCNCCFELEMKLAELFTDSLKIFYMKEEIVFTQDDISSVYEPFELKESKDKYVFPTPSELQKFESFDGDVNLLTDNGKKTGLWRHSTEKYNYLSYYHLDENGELLSRWRAIYSLEGQLEEICGYDNVGDISSCASSYDYNHLFGIKN